jgi:hypothetical protein
MQWLKFRLSKIRYFLRTFRIKIPKGFTPWFAQFPIFAGETGGGGSTKSASLAGKDSSLSSFYEKPDPE